VAVDEREESAGKAEEEEAEEEGVRGGTR